MRITFDQYGPMQPRVIGDDLSRGGTIEVPVDKGSGASPEIRYQFFTVKQKDDLVEMLIDAFGRDAILEVFKDPAFDTSTDPLMRAAYRVKFANGVEKTLGSIFAQMADPRDDKGLRLFSDKIYNFGIDSETKLPLPGKLEFNGAFLLFTPNLVPPPPPPPPPPSGSGWVPGLMGPGKAVGDSGIGFTDKDRAALGRIEEKLDRLIRGAGF